MSLVSFPAPALHISHWLGTASPITLAGLRGRVVVLHAFQMLCPSCVSHGLPQAARIHGTFAAADVAVIGIHTVFEHHAVMGVEALKAFMHEYRIDYPVGVDQASPGSDIPLTMQAYSLQGTPSLVLIDRQGSVRLQHFGHLDDLAVGALIGQLVAQGQGVGNAHGAAGAGKVTQSHCDDSGCAIDQ
ncbi:MAG: redoxin domain-containing protein [Burkholderiaceae bacterium]